MSELDALVNSTNDIEPVIISALKDGKTLKRYTGEELAQMAAQFDLDVEELRSIMTDIEARNEHWIDFNGMNPYNKLKAEILNKYKFIFNEVLDKSFYKERGTQSWRLFEEAPVIDYLKGEVGIKTVSDKDVNYIVHSVSDHVNPIKMYFKALPEWDGEDHLKKFCDCIDTDEPEFLYTMLKKNLVRTIKCAFEDDYENRYLFILVGGQQSGKTKMIQFLNPFYEDRGYGKYHNHNPIKMGEKDAIIQSSKCFFWNIDEFEVLRGKEISHLKSIISQGNTTIRPAYSKHERNVIRRCSYFASTNRTEFLSDNENTRYLCINVLNNKSNQIRWREYLKIGVDQIWSQIYALYKDSEFKYDLTIDEMKEQDRINNKHNVMTFVSEAMGELYAKPQDGDAVEYLGLIEIKKDVEAKVDEKYISTYAIMDAAGQMGIEFRQYRNKGHNLGKKFAVKRIGEGSDQVNPQHKCLGTWES